MEKVQDVQRRTTKGRYRKEPMGKEAKAAISRGQRVRWEKLEEELGPPPIVGRKKCTQCGEVKGFDRENTRESEFPIARRKLAGGRVRTYPAGPCKTCANAKREEWREKKRAAGELAALQAKWNAARDPEARKVYQREYQTIRRRMAGVPVRGGWKKYRVESKVMVPTAPFMEYVQGEDFLSVGADVREEVRAIGRYDNAELGRIDALLVALGAHHMLGLLYPDVP